MRNGHARGLLFALALLGATAMSARAGDLFRHTIPRETLAKDYRTGGVMMAPPIPYGSYAKDHLGAVHGAIGHVAACVHSTTGLLKGALGKVCGACGGQGNGCGACGGQGCLHGSACGSCGGNGCGGCGGLGLTPNVYGGNGGGLGHGHGGNGLGNGGCASCGDAGAGAGLGHAGHGHGTTVMGPAAKGLPLAASPQYAPMAGSPQGGPALMGPCGKCGGRGLTNSGLMGRKVGYCGDCGGNGRVLGRGGLGHGHGHGGNGGAAMAAGDGSACGPCGGTGQTGAGTCGSCGGCGLLSGAHGALKGLAGKAHGIGQNAMYKMGHGGIEYFVGPGGPVPITPGYVPYVVTTRSPRDFFAFPPYSDRAFATEVVRPATYENLNLRTYQNVPPPTGYVERGPAMGTVTRPAPGVAQPPAPGVPAEVPAPDMNDTPAPPAPGVDDNGGR